MDTVLDFLRIDFKTSCHSKIKNKNKKETEIRKKTTAKKGRNPYIDDKDKKKINQ